MPNNTKRLNIRLTEEEHATLAAYARACGLSITDYVKVRCLEDDGRPRIVTDVEALRKTYSSLRKIGGLLNQLMQHANRRRQDFPSLVGEAEKATIQIRRTCSDVSNLIEDARAKTR